MSRIQRDRLGIVGARKERKRNGEGKSQHISGSIRVNDFEHLKIMQRELWSYDPKNAILVHLLLAQKNLFHLKQETEKDCGQMPYKLL